jgi:Fe-S-cluster-containing hydrogenase component 2
VYEVEKTLPEEPGGDCGDGAAPFLAEETPPQTGIHPTRTQSGLQHNKENNTMYRSLSIDPEKCTGCLQCEMACSWEYEGKFNPVHSRIKVFAFHQEGRFVPYTCTQCADAWCRNACPVEAIRINAETGAKEIVDNRCVGCKVCTIACPFGTVNYDHTRGKVMKCDLCGGDPACVRACPTGAITFVDADWTGYEKMRGWAEKTDNATHV